MIDGFRYYILPPFWVLSLGLLSLVLVILGVTLGAIGIFQEKQNENDLSLNLWESECFVFFIQSMEHSCTFCFDGSCPSQLCYDQRFKVLYAIYNRTQVISTISAKNLTEHLPIEVSQRNDRE